jgi:hypothetical protein
MDRETREDMTRASFGQGAFDGGDRLARDTGLKPVQDDANPREHV